MYFFMKIMISAVVVAGVSELGKKLTWLGAVLASLPVISIIAMIWLYIDTKNAEKVISLSNGIFWAVLPSLLFFAVLPPLIRSGIPFYAAMGLAMLTMFLGYTLYVAILKLAGITF